MFNSIRNTGTKLALATGLMLLAAAAEAAGTDPFSQMFAVVDLSTIVALVIAAGLVIVGIALAFKSPDVAKRVVKKV